MKTHKSNLANRLLRRSIMEQFETRMLLTIASPAVSSTIDPATAAYVGSQNAGVSSTAKPSFTMAQTLSDQAQLTTLAFDGLAMITGNLAAQSFFPPGKVADYTGFQYLRDNDPDNMGHNTSFLTRVANNVINILSDSQLAQLKTLATAQLEQNNLYALKRFTLMQAFRNLMDGNIPSGSTGLNIDAVKSLSEELYAIDGQIAFDRALLYANILNSMTATQKAYLDNMKGKGFNSWADISNALIQSKMQLLPQGTAVAVMTYAGDLFSWYAGSVEADVYFCPERHGTYYGGFYIKDAPAVGHEGYSISEQLTATAGSALCDSSKGYVTQSQAALMSSLLSLQRNNLYAGTTNIVQVRTQIATLLRGLLTSTATSDSVKAQVLALSKTYGDLDGENNFNYINVFKQVASSLTVAQKTKLMDLRKSIMSGKYADGTAFDYSVCTTPFLYSSAVTDTSTLTPYLANASKMFFSPSGTTPEIQLFCGTLEILDGTGSVAFGATTVGTSISKTFTVKNLGAGTLVLTSAITLPAGFAVTSSFGSTSLAAGASTTFVVSLNAAAAGSYSGKLSFTCNDSDESTFDFAISGTVSAATAKAQVLLGTATVADNTGSVSFGSTTADTPVSKTFTIKNVGTGNLVLTGAISVPTGFTVVSSFGSTTLAAGASTTFVVRLNATSPGTFAGRLSFATNDSSAATFDFAISGTVLPKPAPKIQVLLGSTAITDGTGSVAFGSTKVGSPITKTFTIKNVGNANLLLTSPISVPAVFTVVSSFSATTLAPGASVTFVIRLSATVAGTYSGKLSFGNNDKNMNIFDFTLSGTVLK